MTHFGTSAKFIDAAAKAGLKPRETTTCDTVRAMIHRQPAGAGGFDFVYRDIKADLQLARSPAAPTSSPASCSAIRCCRWRRRDPVPRRSGWRSTVGTTTAAGARREGELVCTAPFPVMPIGFWNDADGSKYRAAYFERFPNVWCHGDFARSPRTAAWSSTAVGRHAEPGRRAHRHRRDLPPGRKLHEVVESLVIGQDWPPEPDVRVVLFVKLREGSCSMTT